MSQSFVGVPAEVWTTEAEERLGLGAPDPTTFVPGDEPAKLSQEGAAEEPLRAVGHWKLAPGDSVEGRDVLEEVVPETVPAEAVPEAVEDQTVLETASSETWQAETVLGDVAQEGFDLEAAAVEPDSGPVVPQEDRSGIGPSCRVPRCLI